MNIFYHQQYVYNMMTADFFVVIPKWMIVAMKDLQAAAVLSEMLNLHKNLHQNNKLHSLGDHGDGWMFFTEDECQERLQVNHKAFLLIRKRLIEMGLIESIRYGVPSRNYYRPIFDNLSRWISDNLNGFSKNVSETQIGVSRNPKSTSLDNQIGVSAPYILVDTREDTYTPPYPPQAGEPADAGMGPVSLPDSPTSSEPKPVSAKKLVAKVEFSPAVQQLAAKMIEVLKQNSRVFRTPKEPVFNLLLATCQEMLEEDGQDADYLLKLLDYAAADRTERGDFKGWSAMIYSKGDGKKKLHGFQKFRNSLGSIEASMKAKPVRKFAPSSDDEKSLEKWKEWKKDAL